MASGSQAGSTREYFVKVAKSKKRYHALKFNVGNDIDFTNNTKADLAREGYYQPRQEWEQLPKAGAGSEFNRENKEVARRKKFGFHSKGQNVDDLPWILTVKNDSEKDRLFRAKRSVANNSSYFVFINNAEIGGFEAHPLEDWYTFTPYRTYKTLTIEEAEEEFSKRHKILNKYSIMANRRKAQAEAEDDGEGGGAGESKKSGGRGGGGGGGGSGDRSGGKSKSKWNDSGDENLSDDDEEEGGGKDDRSDDESKPKGKKGGRSKGDGDEDGEMQLNEESDDGDHEGDELDYISSSSEESEGSDFEQTKNEEKYEEKGIDEEAAIKALEEEEDEDEEDKKLTEEGKEYKKLISQTLKEDDEASKDSAKKSSEHSRGSANSSDSSDIEDPDNDPTIVTTLLDNKKAFLSATAALNEPASGKSSKRKATDDLSNQHSKRTNTDEAKTKLNKASTAPPTTPLPPAAPSLMFEDEVRRYLKRKPMTVKELISKFKKKTTMSNEALTEHLGKIFNKLKESSDFKIEEKGGTKYLSLM